MKSLLALAIPAVLFATAATAAPAAPQTAIIGTWLAVYNGGVVSAVAQWQVGGTTVQNPTLSPAGGSLLLGNWRVKASGALSVSLRGWTFDDTGAVDGYWTKTETDHLQDDAQGYDGRFQVTFYDLKGNVTFQQGGSLIAHRLP